MHKQVFVLDIVKGIVHIFELSFTYLEVKGIGIRDYSKAVNCQTKMSHSNMGPEDKTI